MASTPATPISKPRKARAANGTRTNHHSVTVNFTEPEDIELYDRLEAASKAERRSLNLYILLGLHDHFPAPQGTEQ